MANKTIYNRADHTKEAFAKISNKALYDPNLSNSQIGLLIRVLGNANNFIVYKSYFQSISGNGRTQFEKDWDRLVELGYIMESVEVTPKGKVYTYIICEIPTVGKSTVGNSSIIEKIPTVGIPTVGNPTVGNQTTNKTNNNKTKENKTKEKEYMSPEATCEDGEKDLPYEDEENKISHSHEVESSKGEFFEEIKEVYKYLSEKTGKNFSPDSKHSKHLRGRFREYGESLTVEILKGVVDMKVNDWKGDPKMKNYLRPDTLFNSEKFEKYLDQYLESPVKRTNSLSYRESIFTIDDLKKLEHLNDNDILIVDFLPTNTGRQFGMIPVRQANSTVKSIKSNIHQKNAIYQIVGYWDGDSRKDVLFEKSANPKESIIDQPHLVEIHLRA